MYPLCPAFTPFVPSFCALCTQPLHHSCPAFVPSLCALPSYLHVLCAQPLYPAFVPFMSCLCAQLLCQFLCALHPAFVPCCCALCALHAQTKGAKAGHEEHKGAMAGYKDWVLFCALSLLPAFAPSEVIFVSPPPFGKGMKSTKGTKVQRAQIGFVSTTTECKKFK